MPPALKSIRAKLCALFLALGGFTAVFGLFAIDSIRDNGRLVAETYDKPLMAINFARSAMYVFSQMGLELLRASTAPSGTISAPARERLRSLKIQFEEDLGVTHNRSSSGRSISVIEDIRSLFAQWHGICSDMARSGFSSDKWNRINALTRQINDRFELLVDVTAGDGFLLRQDALQAIERSRVANMAGMAIVLSLSLLVTILLGRSILRPLASAVRVADRISRGDLQAPIPAPNEDETGRLLQSMRVMQDNLRAMMDREVALRKTAQARLADALENCSEAVVVADNADRIVIANRRIAQLFPSVSHMFGVGYQLSTAVNACNVHGLIDPQVGSPEILEDLKPPATSDHPIIGEIRLNDGRWLRVSRNRTSEGGGVIFYSEITELKLREENLARAKAQAEAASDAKSTFLATVSHELRTPLNAINGFSEIIVSEVLGPVGVAQYKEYASDILDSGQRLLAVINDILDVANSETGTLSFEPTAVDIASLVRDATPRLVSLCERGGLTFTIDCADDLPPVHGDPHRLNQILGNLVSNAAKFTPDGGAVSIKLSGGEDGWFCLAVSDTGVGMSTNDYAKALEPFGQIDNALNRKYEGTGLGLPLTKILVEMHGGRLKIDSVLGEGTTVYVLLPPPAQGKSIPTVIASHRHNVA